jgi:hypothetical protein
MLAESLLRTISSSLAWLIFVTLVLASASAIPLAAWFVRRRLTSSRGASSQGQKIALETVRFGTSQKARRSPRHAVAQHRVLMTSVLVAVLVMFVLPGVVSLPILGVQGLQVGLALVVPTLLIVLHARQRNLAR